MVEYADHPLKKKNEIIIQTSFYQNVRMATKEEDLTSGFSRDCIECDGPDCSVIAPSQRCSRCRTTFYCSLRCQKKHWKVEHKSYCFPLEEMRDKLNSKQKDQALDLSELLHGDAVSVTPDQECPICLSSPMQKPVTLRSCQHSFCTNCMIEWQKQSLVLTEQHLQNRTSPSCPLCRTESENVEESLFSRALLLGREANTRDLDQEGRQALRREALSCLERVIASSKNYTLRASFTQAEILVSLGDGDGALKAIEDLLNENNRRMNHPIIKKIQQADACQARGDFDEAERLQGEVVEMFSREGSPPDRLPKSSIVSVYVLQSQAYQVLEDWENAVGSYVTALKHMDNVDALPPAETRKLFMGMAECSFKAGMYERAIATSDVALEMNRSFDQVHKYKALAYKEMGNIEDAIKTMNRAILYETPWNSENIQKNIALYNQLVAEQE